MTWVPVHSEQDVEQLLSEFGGFHDCCLREIHFWTEHFVSGDLSMTCSSGLDTRVRMLLQRQSRDPSAIELLFERVSGFHLAPRPEKKYYSFTAFEADLKIRTDGVFYWSDGDPAREQGDWTWLTAEALSWRRASEWMGETLRYGPQEPGTDSDGGAAA